MTEMQMRRERRDADIIAGAAMIMMTEAYSVKQAPAEALQRLRAARDKVATLRARACSIGAVRYDRDRVQSSHTHDLSDDMCAIDDAAEAAWLAYIEYLAMCSSLRLCCMAAGFGDAQTNIWMMYYAYGHSMGSIALLTGRTKSQVQYLLTGVRPERDFCLGINAIAESGEIYDS